MSSAAIEIPRTPRTEAERIHQELTRLNQLGYQHSTELAGLSAELYELRGSADAFLIGIRRLSAMEHMPPALRARFESYVCDALYQLRLASDGLAECKQAILRMYLEASEPLELEYLLALGYTPEEIAEADAAAAPKPTPEELEQHQRALEFEKRLATDACPHGVLLSNWREPCPECRTEREAELAKLELKAQMARIRSRPVA